MNATLASAPGDGPASVVLGAIILGLVFVMYWLPTFVAVMRRRPAIAIGMLNGFLGWTMLGWVIALVWAFTSPPAPPTVIVQAAPPAPPAPGA